MTRGRRSCKDNRVGGTAKRGDDSMKEGIVFGKFGSSCLILVWWAGKFNLDYLWNDILVWYQAGCYESLESYCHFTTLGRQVRTRGIHFQYLSSTLVLQLSN